MRAPFRAFVVDQTAEGFQMGIQLLEQRDLPPGDMLIQVAYAAVNYKDALVCIPNGNVARTSPLVPGLELTGAVVSRPIRVTSQAIPCWPMILAALRGFPGMVATVSTPVSQAIFSFACLQAWTASRPMCFPQG